MPKLHQQVTDRTRMGTEGIVAPQPFGRAVTVVIALARASETRVAVFDLDGRLVRTLLPSSVAGAGRRTLVWDGIGDDGRTVPAGVYWVRMAWPGGRDGRRIIKLD